MAAEYLARVLRGMGPGDEHPEDQVHDLCIT